MAPCQKRFLGKMAKPRWVKKKGTQRRSSFTIDSYPSVFNSLVLECPLGQRLPLTNDYPFFALSSETQSCCTVPSSYQSLSVDHKIHSGPVQIVYVRASPSILRPRWGPPFFGTAPNSHFAWQSAWQGACQNLAKHLARHLARHSARQNGYLTKFVYIS